MEPAQEVEFVFEPQQEGGYHVYAPELPGLHTQGDTLEKASESAREALELYVDGLRARMVVRSRWGSFGACCHCPRERAAAGLSGQQLIDALKKVGWVVVRERGSHLRLKHDARTIALVVPLHRELKRGTLAGILRDAGIDRDDLRQLL